jgi:hypothetical protein
MWQRVEGPRLLAAWQADPSFTADAASRRQRLRALQIAVEDAPCDPERNDARYLVNAPIDELPVVSPEPGIWPERASSPSRMGP